MVTATMVRACRYNLLATLTQQVIPQLEEGNARVQRQLGPRSVPRLPLFDFC